MAMHWIATQTTTSTSQVTFSSIPQTFAHLQVRISGRDASATTINSSFIQINNFGGTYPYFHILSGDGASAISGASVSSVIAMAAIAGANASANITGSVIVDLYDYASTTKNKTIKSFGGADLNGSGQVQFTSGFIASTSAITSIIVGGAFNSPYAFAAGTRVDLYGITSNPIATGA
jgi:hypothetical protein